MKGLMMRVLFSRFGLSAIFLVFLSSATTIAQTTYTVGGAGANYATLEQLRTSGVLRDGDTIILNANDNSLRGSLSNTVTIQGSGRITPAVATNFIDHPRRNSSITLDSGSLEFSGFSAHWGGVLHADTVSIAGGRNSFFNNMSNSWGGVINASEGVATISGGTNTFVGNTSFVGGGAITNEFDGVFITGGTNMFFGNTAAHEGGGAIFTDNEFAITGGTNTFVGNTTTGRGGAVNARGFTRDGGGAVHITDGTNTFAGNSAYEGGAIHVRGDANITGGTNSFTENTATLGGAIYAGDAVDRGNVNLIDGTNTFARSCLH